MPRDAITTVKDTEARARAIEEDAKVKAREMIEETERSCIEFCEKEERELKAELDERLELLRRKSERLVEKNAQSNDERAQEILESARLRMRGAVKIILQEIEKQCR